MSVLLAYFWVSILITAQPEQHWVESMQHCGELMTSAVEQVSNSAHCIQVECSPWRIQRGDFLAEIIQCSDNTSSFFEVISYDKDRQLEQQECC